MWMRTILVFLSMSCGTTMAADPMQTLYLIQRLMPMDSFAPALETAASLGRIADWGWEMNHTIKTVPHAVREVNRMAPLLPATEGSAMRDYSAWISRTVIREVDDTLRQTNARWMGDMQNALVIPAKARGNPAWRTRLDQAWQALESKSAFEHGNLGQESEETRRMRDKLAEAEGKWAGLTEKLYKKYTMPTLDEDTAPYSEIARQSLALSNQSADLRQPVVQSGEQERESTLFIAPNFHPIAWRELEAWALDSAPDGEFVRVVVLRNYSQPPPNLISGQWLIHRSWRLGPVDIPTATTLPEEEEPGEQKP